MLSFLSRTPLSPTTRISLLSERYHLFEQVGLGGFCQIFRAWDTDEQRPVAIKMLRDDLSTDQRATAMYQVQHEAHVLASLTHAAIPSLYEYNTHLHMLALPYIDGYPLTRALKQAKRGLPLEDIFALGSTACQVLSYIHQQRIVLCDLSANNILIQFDGVIFFIDFGIAHRLGEARHPLLRQLGTPGFAAPELYPNARDEISPASDIYSLGALLQYACSGKDPTCEPTSFAFPRLSRRIPPDLHLLISAMLDPEPDGRPTLYEVRHTLTAGHQACVH